MSRVNRGIRVNRVNMVRVVFWTWLVLELLLCLSFRVMVMSCRVILRWLHRGRQLGECNMEYGECNIGEWNISGGA